MYVLYDVIINMYYSLLFSCRLCVWGFVAYMYVLLFVLFIMVMKQVMQDRSPKDSVFSVTQETQKVITRYLTK